METQQSVPENVFAVDIGLAVFTFVVGLFAGIGVACWWWTL